MKVGRPTGSTIKKKMKKMNKCSHLKLKIVYLSTDEGSVQLSICEECSHIETLCEHTQNKWVYTRNQEDPDEQKLICKLCGIDGT